MKFEFTSAEVDREAFNPFLKTVFERMPLTPDQLCELISGVEVAQVAAVCEGIALYDGDSVPGSAIVVFFEQYHKQFDGMRLIILAKILGWLELLPCACGRKDCEAHNLRVTSKGREAVAIYKGWLTEMDGA